MPTRNSIQLTLNFEVPETLRLTDEQSNLTRLTSFHCRLLRFRCVDAEMLQSFSSNDTAIGYQWPATQVVWVSRCRQYWIPTVSWCFANFPNRPTELAVLNEWTTSIRLHCSRPLLLWYFLLRRTEWDSWLEVERECCVLRIRWSHMGTMVPANPKRKSNQIIFKRSKIATFNFVIHSMSFDVDSRKKA